MSGASAYDTTKEAIWYLSNTFALLDSSDILEMISKYDNFIPVWTKSINEYKGDARML